MDTYTKRLYDKLNLAYELILAYQQWFNDNHIISIRDEKIRLATENFTGVKL